MKDETMEELDRKLKHADVLEQNEQKLLQQFASLDNALVEKIEKTVKTAVAQNYQIRIQKLFQENKQLSSQLIIVTDGGREYLRKLNLCNQENQKLKQNLDQSSKEISNLKQLVAKHENQLPKDLELKYEQQIQAEICKINSAYRQEYESKLEEYQGKLNKNNIDLESMSGGISKLTSQHEKDKEEWMCKLRKEIQSGITARADLEKEHQLTLKKMEKEHDLKLKEMEKEYQRKEKSKNKEIGQTKRQNEQAQQRWNSQLIEKENELYRIRSELARNYQSKLQEQKEQFGFKLESRNKETERKMNDFKQEKEALMNKLRQENECGIEASISKLREEHQIELSKLRQQYQEELEAKEALMQEYEKVKDGGKQERKQYGFDFMALGKIFQKL